MCTYSFHIILPGTLLGTPGTQKVAVILLLRRVHIPKTDKYSPTRQPLRNQRSMKLLMARAQNGPTLPGSKTNEKYMNGRISKPDWSQYLG